VGEAGANRVVRVEPGIYLVRLSGHLTAVLSTELTDIVANDPPKGPRAVIYETTETFTGYDPDLRTVKFDQTSLTDTAHIGIVTTSAILRMVTATIALALRTTKGIPMASYGSVETAVEGCRDALRRKQSRR
jgi:hypothetical protein